PSRMLSADVQRCAVQLEHRIGIPRFAFHRVVPQRVGLWQPWLPRPRAEAERRRAARPRPRHPTAIAPAHGVGGTLPEWVLEHVLGKIIDLPQPELLTLIDVHAAG